MTRPLLQLTDVTRRFPAGDQEVIALKNVNLSIGAGEFVAIVGASGSGKSTLMNILGCLDHPSAGSYRVGGRETRDLDEDALAQLRRERFGFIFQRYHLLPHLNSVANVELPAVYADTLEAERQARARQILSRLGLADRAEHRPGQLSGGQQQRVSIARALMNGGEVILADEPTGALDSKSGQSVIQILHELNANGHTIIIVTHDEHVAAHACRIIEIRDGVIVADQPNTPVLRLAPACATAQAKAPTDPTDHPTPHQAGAQRWSASAIRFVEAMRMAWFALASHRLRTILTILGITIGVMSVVSLVAIGGGAKRYLLELFGSIGTNMISIYPGRDWGDGQAEAIQTLVPADVAALAEQHYIDSATPEMSRSLLLRYRNIGVSAFVSGVGEQYFRVRGMKLAQGIGFGLDELGRQAQVAVIDQNTRRKLFGSNPNALGEVILVDSVPFIVIGVTTDSKRASGDTKNLNVWVPSSTASARLFGQHHLDSITVRIRDGQSSKAVENSVERLMTQRHGRKDFFTYNQDSVAKATKNAGQSMALFLLLIGAITLVVGGIGVMNIMLVSVTERTGEIGIRMAVGARQSDIMLQFLVEAVMMCLVGGIIGIMLSFGTRFIFSMFVTKWSMVFSVESIIVAFLCSTLIGILFGIVPARHAARLNPIDALARE
ncbi:MacB family efflux pump subunit [Cupriavidus sp. PET2-C1]